ncbi:MAG: hypothetical protein OEU91_07705, partial [Gammaproteobacteria bacterium]|nr:hypothetical protein [Gammaproteobacteria bacterium]
MPRLPFHRESLDGVVYPDSQGSGFDPVALARNRKRIRIFLSTVIISLSISLSYTFLRPAIYESSATLLVTPPVIDDRVGDVANAQHVELELQFLTGHTLLSGVLETLSSAGQLSDTPDLTLSDLQEMLAAVSIENTNLIELTARGPDKYLLPAAINTWAEAYQSAHSDTIKVESESDTTAIDQQLDELKSKVEEKRLALDRFRKEYDIVSMERDENRTLRKLSGLSDSLNKANEEKVAAQSHLGAIRAAIAQGRPVVDSNGQDGLANLEQRLVEIQEQLKELESEFTPRYMSVDPKIKGLQRKRELLEQEIRNKRDEGQQKALAVAEQDYASARQAVLSLRRQLDDHKQQTMDFNTRFAEHEAMQEELLQLETTYREVQDHQLQMQVNTRSQYLQVRIKEPAFLPERPGYPDYARDAGISVAASLMAGLLLLLLYDFLTRPARHSVAHDIKQVFMTSPETRMLGQVADVPLPQSTVVPALELQLPRELSQAEVEELFRVAGPDVRLLIACLLSGLTAFEVSDLQWSDIDKDALVIHVSGKSDRAIAVTPPLLAAIEAFMPAVAEADS